MDSSDLLIIGSGPGAVSAAESYRDNGGGAHVLMITTDADAPYFRPPLSKEFLQGESEFDDITQHPQPWYADHDIEIRTGTSVVGLDIDARTAKLSTSETVDFATAIVATGARPATIPVPGAGNALILRSFAEAKALRTTAQQADSAVVIGAGFIGCEAAASLSARGITTTLLAPSLVPQARRLGPDAGRKILGMLGDSGVRYVGGATVTRLDDGVVTTDDGVRIDTDLILAATGIMPCVDIAQDAGLTTEQGRIVVDEHMRTSADGILAVGDVVTAHNPTAGRRVATEHWQDAADQGEVAGATAAGVERSWDAVPGFWTTIGEHTLKYAAWGDGFDAAHLIEEDQGFTVWYRTAGVTVGALTYNSDDNYALAERLVADHKPAPA